MAPHGADKGVELTMAGEAVKNGNHSFNLVPGNRSGIIGSNCTRRAQYIPAASCDG